jgi:hypothetical protein
VFPVIMDVKNVMSPDFRNVTALMIVNLVSISKLMNLNHVIPVMSKTAPLVVTEEIVQFVSQDSVCG